MKATASAVRNMRTLGWADFKHKLVRIGVIETADHDVPEDWKKAFCKAHNRPYPMI